MSIVLWGILSLIGGFLALWIAARRAMPEGPPLPAGTELPATPLQRTARWTLGVGAVLGVAAASLVVVKGAEATFADDTLRLTFTILLLTILVAVGVPTLWIRSQATRRDGALDERDRAILGKAPAMQAVGMIVTLAIWTVGLSERFHDAGAVPVVYVYVVFWSCVVVDLLGLPVGVLAGYRRR